MTAAEALLHFRYTRWASQKLLDAAACLDDETRQRFLGVSHESIVKTLGHTYLADRIWYTRVVEPDLPLETDAPWEMLATKWQEILDGWERWATSLDDAALERVVAYRSLNGDPFESPVWQIVLHVVNHATLHRGQVMAMLRQVGVKPPGTDLIFYYRELDAARKA